MRKKIMVGLVASVALVLFGGWWLFLRDNAPPPPDLASAIEIASAAQATTTSLAVTTTFSATTTTSPSTTTSLQEKDMTELSTTTRPMTEVTTVEEVTTPAGINGVWNVDTSIGSFGIDESTSSFVGFRIKEVLGRGIGEVTAVGRTPQVEGRINFSEGALIEVEISADLRGLRTDRSSRDSKVQQALNTNEHPRALFILDEKIVLDGNEAADVSVLGSLSVNGVLNPIQVQLQAQLVGEIMTVVGTFDIVLSDYEVEAPSAPIVASVEDNAIVEVQLFFVEGS